MSFRPSDWPRSYAFLALLFAVATMYVVAWASFLFAPYHRVVQVFSAIAIVLLVPCVVYEHFVKEKSHGSILALKIAATLWIATTLTTPDFEQETTWTVYGSAGDGHPEHRTTAEKKFHCREDCLAAGRAMLAESENWIPELESDFEYEPGELSDYVYDVLIEHDTIVPKWEQINRVLGTRYGRKFYTTTMRYFDKNEDPLGVIWDQQPYDDGREREYPY